MTLKQGLGKKYTSNVKNSWQAVWETVAEVMLSGAEMQLPELPSLSGQEIELIQKSWNRVVMSKGNLTVGTILFGHLFNQNHYLLYFFPFQNDYTLSPIFKKHASMVVENVTFAIENLGNMEALA